LPRGDVRPAVLGRDDAQAAVVDRTHFDAIRGDDDRRDGDRDDE
jgi:hypothetical protein